jgi:AAA family ATP:ADP antiporter
MFGLRVRRAEIGITTSLAGYFFLLVAAQYLIKPARNALFLEGLGADSLPYVYIGTAAATWIAVVLYVRLAPRARLVPLFRGTLVFLIANLFGFWWLLPRAGGWILAIFYIWAKLYAVLLPSQFWLLANELLDPRTARRLFAPLGAGGILGSIAGSAMAGWLAHPLGTRALLLAAAGVLLVAIAMLQFVTISSARDPSVRSVTDEGRPERGRGAFDPSRVADGRLPEHKSRNNTIGRGSDSEGGGHRPLVVLIAVLLAVTILVHTIVDWQFNKAAEMGIRDLDARTSFFGRFFTLLNLVTLAIQLFATSFVLRVFGLGAALMILPAALAFGAVGILLHPGLWAATLARGADDSLRYSIDQSARELLFLPLPSALRQNLKPRIDLIATRVANGVGGVLILAVVKVADDPLTTLSFLSLALTTAWLVMARSARQRYADGLKHLLTVRDVDVAYLARSHLDAGGRDAIHEGLSSGDEATIHAALDLVAHTEPSDFVADLRQLVRSSSDPKTRRKALHLLTEAGDRGAINEALEFLDQPDRSLTAEALAYAFAAGDANAEDQIETHLSGEDPLLAIAAAVCLLEQSDPDQQGRGVRILDQAVSLADREDKSEVRRAIVEAIRTQPISPGLDVVLTRLLQDDDVDVVRSALTAAARPGDTTMVMPVCQAGLRRTLRTPALQVLETIGEAAVGPLTGALADPRNSRPLRQLAARALSRIAGSAAAAGLLAGVAVDDPAVRRASLRGLNHLRRRGQDLELGEDGLREVVRIEWHEFLSLNRILSALGEPATANSRSFMAVVVHERLEQALERLFRALALRHPIQTVFFAYQGLVSGDQVARANALELVDTMVEGPLRRPLVALLEEEDASARGRMAAAELGLVPPSLEEALGELLNPGDPWVAACALAALRTIDAAPLPVGLESDLRATAYKPLVEFLDANDGAI